MIGAVAGVAAVAILFLVMVFARGSTVKPRFSPEYRTNVNMKNPRWRALRTETFAMSRGRDVVLPFLRAQQLDHLRYRINGHNIFGFERPMVDVVPLSRFTHTIVTLLRRGGLRGPVNAVLRGSFLLWFRIVPFMGWFVSCVFGVYVVAVLLEFAGLVRGLPLPRWPAHGFSVPGAIDGVKHAMNRLRSF